MSPTLKALGIDQMSVAQRVVLVEEIWDSIADEQESKPLTDAQRSDLQRRLAAYEADPKTGSTWEKVKARLRLLADVLESQQEFAAGRCSPVSPAELMREIVE